MEKFKYDVGAVVLLKDSRRTLAKVVDRVEGEPAIYILEAHGTHRRYELTEEDIDFCVFPNLG